MSYFKKEQLAKFQKKKRAKKRKGKSFHRWYDSTAEKDRALELIEKERIGDIFDLELNPVVKLVEGFDFRPDSHYFESGSGREVYEDVKGAGSDRFNTACRLWLYHGLAVLLVVKRKSITSPFVVTKQITPM